MEVQKSGSFFENLKNQIEQFFSNLQITSTDIITWVSAFGIGFAIGLLFKRYGKYIISGLILVILSLAVLSYFDFIVFNPEKIKVLLGFHTTETLENILNGILLQAKVHFLELGMVLLGCLLGFKLG